MCLFHPPFLINCYLALPCHILVLFLINCTNFRNFRLIAHHTAISITNHNQGNKILEKLTFLYVICRHHYHYHHHLYTVPYTIVYVRPLRYIVFSFHSLFPDKVHHSVGVATLLPPFVPLSLSAAAGRFSANKHFFLPIHPKEELTHQLNK